MRLWWRLAAPILFVAPALSGMCQQNQPVSLGDVARQSKPTQKARRVITDEDMPQRTVDTSASSSSTGSSGGGSSTTAAATPAPGSSSSDSGTPEATAKPNTASQAKAGPGNPEAEALRARIKEVVSDQLGLENVIRDTEAKIETEDDPNRRDTLKDMLKNSKASLERRKAEAADLKSRLNGLEPKK